MIMKTLKIFVNILVVLILAGLGGLFYFTYDISRPLGSLEEKKVFTIEKGDGVNQVAIKLKEQNILKRTFNFETYLWLRNLEDNLQAGEYQLTSDLSAKDLAHKFTQGDILPAEVWVTIPEGFTSKEIEKRLLEKGLISKEGEFTKKIENYEYDFIGQSDYSGILPSLEGYLFPDTYKFYRDSSLPEIINKMLANFNQKLTTDLVDEIKHKGKSVREIVILASIVEKEVRSIEDMRKVASVFYNRLEIGMALESDATVNFATGKSRRQATFEDLETDSPYNTYRYKGLPPSAISNPGLNAIMATVYPDDTDYLYFLSPENGSTIFSRTLDEHNKAKAQYLK